MYVKFEPSGTHIQKGYLKVRLDVFPEPGDKTYPFQRVKVEGKWQTNPCLSHFVKIDPDFNSFDKLARQIFDKDTLRKLDDLLVGDNLEEVANLMSTKRGTGKQIDSLSNELRNNINSRFSSLEV